MQEQGISPFNLECCQKCDICTRVCPVMQNNPLYAGPKQSGPDGERYRLKNGIFFDDALKYCLNCKRCEVACPSSVRIADMIQAAKAEYGTGRTKLRDVMLANTDAMGSMVVPFAPVANFALSLSGVKGLMDLVIGVDHRRTMPRYASQTFVSWFKKNKMASQSSFDRQVSYFHGCYANYNYPQLGKDFVSVLNALGYGVRLLEGERCCGVAKIANSLTEAATKDAVRNISLIRAAVEEGREVLTVSTSCTLTIVDEYPHLLGVENADVRDHISLVEKFIFNLISSGEAKFVWKKDYKATAAYHCPCHQMKLGHSIFTTELLKMIPGLELKVLTPNCCGIAGTYGFKKENFRTSQSIGQPLFDEISALDPDFVACECETCKWQIEMSAGVPVKNPVTILAEALDLEATFAANNRG